MNTKNLTRIIELVAAARTDVDRFIENPYDYDRVEYFEDVLVALNDALDLLDPKEEIR